MIPSLHNGVSALKSFSEGLQVLSNNIANVNSLGYKSARANFTDNFYIHQNNAGPAVGGEPQNTTRNYGSGVSVGSLSSNFNQGIIENTGLDLDLAIQGEALPNGGGFFEVIDPESGEVFYTRAGAFESTAEGIVVTRDQNRFQLTNIQDQPLLLGLEDGEDLLARRIDDDGVVSLIVSKDGQDSIRVAGQVKIANFQAPQYLQRTGNGLYSNGQPGENFAGLVENSIPGSGSNGKIKQYALELSNVDLTNEFAMMISHQRSFQAGSRIVTTSDAILTEAVNLKR
ncbi:flagellar hook basal-body protein [Opitutales bacterium]|jgi:flagellar hook protein FlgE|nr:flagellar hook basal-body protein [Opitutales bacterium]